jgi:alkanesulfonate monooxygenase SsuD/methylene tetrahydromethanopterin reductase-like flavin-dependent oxidoreductase (luciferase family)
MAHDTRYRYAKWIQVIKRLWSEQHFDHHGNFYIKDGYMLPKPVNNLSCYH